MPGGRSEYAFQNLGVVEDFIERLNAIVLDVVLDGGKQGI